MKEKSIKKKITKKETAKTKQKKFPELKLDPKEMMASYVYFGHRKTRTHPGMSPFIHTIRNGVAIIDLEKTIENLEKALKFLFEIVSEGGKVLFVGTKVPAKDIVKEVATELDMPYVNERWLGGTLTNFKTIAKRLDYLKGFEKKKKEGELEKYTKKERHEFDVELRKLNEKFGGIKEMTKLPDALFVVDLKKDSLAAKEAKRVGIPVVSLCDTNTDPSWADWPIPANDDAIQSLKYIFGKVAEVLKKAEA